MTNETSWPVASPPPPARHRQGERGHACCATAVLDPLARETANHRRENYLQTQHSTRPALEQPPVEATSRKTQPASLRCALRSTCLSEHRVLGTGGYGRLRAAQRGGVVLPLVPRDSSGQGGAGP